MKIMALCVVTMVLLSTFSLYAVSARPGISGPAAIEKTAAGVQPGTVFRNCAECPELVVIPAGDFVMGSPANEQGRFDEEGPQRRVHIGKLAVGKFHVTRGQWAAFASATNRGTSGGCAWSGLPGSKGDQPNPAATWRNFGFPQDDAHPVVCVTHGDAEDYMRWMSRQTGHHYRLLTEAEWEYASRAGSTTPYPWGPALAMNMPTMVPRLVAPAWHRGAIGG